MFSIYSESHPVERTNLSEIPNGHWYGFRTKTTVINRNTLLWIWDRRQICLLRAQYLGAEMPSHLDCIQCHFPAIYYSWDTCLLEIRKRPRKVEESVCCLVRPDIRLTFPHK